jgi:vacuolar-type H+-ATPase subunit H
MTDKEFKRLRRSDLIEILYEYQRREKALQDEIAELKARLESRELKLKEAGSIAEAAVKLNELFETAQKTADDYVEQVRRNAEQEMKEIKEAAEQEAAEIIRKAKEQTGAADVQAPEQSAAEAEPEQIPEQPAADAVQVPTPEQAAAAIAQFEFPKTAYAVDGLMPGPAAFEGEKEYAG